MNHGNVLVMSRFALLTVLLCTWHIAPTHSQDNANANAIVSRLKDGASRYSDLNFPSSPSELGFFSNFSNGLFKPKSGDGPFPALVISHTCGGIRQQDIKPWVEAGLSKGYVVLIPDSMRGNQRNCSIPLSVPDGRRLKDMYDASAHLAKLPFIDNKRIAAIGFSQGALMAAYLASPSLHREISPGATRYAATIGLYGTCEWPIGSLKQLSTAWRYVFDDSDRPLLFLLGGADNETPSEYCDHILPKLQAKGAPIEWHRYPQATHCWDCNSLDGFSKIDHKGERVTYRYDKEITEDSRQRVFDFLDRALKSQ